MNISHIAALSLLLASCHAIGSEKLNLVYSSAELQAQADSPESFNFVLPEFKAFDKEGRNIFSEVGGTDEFQTLLAQALKAPTPTDNHIKTELALVTLDGSEQPPTIAYQAYDFTFVEYWADWCAPCHEQMETVRAFIDAHPKWNILWLKVEKDPLKLNGIIIEDDHS